MVSRLTFFRGMLVRGFPPPYRGTGHAFDRGNDELGGRNDECGGGVIQAHSKPRNVIFVPRYENWHCPHPSGFRRRIGFGECFRRKDEVGSGCGRR